MSKDRVIHLLSDEEISYILTGLRLAGQQYIKQDCNEDANIVSALYNKIDTSLDVGVIGNERM